MGSRICRSPYRCDRRSGIPETGAGTPGGGDKHTTCERPNEKAGPGMHLWLEKL